MKRFLGLLLIFTVVMGIISGCSNNSDGFKADRTINVVTREEGSGTRGAFVEIVGIIEEDENGEEVDRTYEEAIVQNSTNAVMTTVAGDDYSIGYISLGSLNDTVKAVQIDGVEATAENILSGSYKLSRPFNLAYKGDLSLVAQDFLNFILSSQGQEVVANEGYVKASIQTPSYEAIGSHSGTVVVAGSTSVTPLMEKLAEAYEKLHPDVSIEIQSTGSSAGMQSAMEGTADIGMASRDLKDSELAELTNVVIALDGIAVIINNNNPIENLSLENLKSIYMGEITSWSEIE